MFYVLIFHLLDVIGFYVLVGACMVYDMLDGICGSFMRHVHAGFGWLIVVFGCVSCGT